MFTFSFSGIGVQAENIAVQPVGLASALIGTEERIANVKKIQPNDTNRCH
jgi:hypothetical protein